MSNSGNLSITDLSNLAEESTEEQIQVNKEKEEYEEARLIMLAISGPGKWNIFQETLIEIEADCKIKEGLGQKYPNNIELLQLLKKRIEIEYDDDIVTRDALLKCLPVKQTISKWHKTKGWEDALLDKMKSYGLFTPEKRAEVIESLRKRATQGEDTQAAKIWLTMSGDYSDKVDVKDTKFEKYKDYVDSLKSSKVIK